VKRIPYLILIIGTIVSIGLSACLGDVSSLDGSNWDLETYQDEAGEMVGVLPGSITTALFQANYVSGIAGCNRFNADYEVDGNDLSFGPVATTRKLCADPPGIMEQESAFLSALSEVASYELDDESLVMFDSMGDIRLTFTTAGE